MQKINSTVLSSDAKYFSVEKPINPYYHDKEINYDDANKEHLELKKTLESAGINVITVPSPVACQDGVYTANWALVRNGKAVMSHLPNVRQAEEAHAKSVLENMGIETITLPDNLKFSGQGDALACGDLLFCGQGYRSDAEAQKIAAETLGYRRIQLKTIPQLDDQGQPVINKSSGWADSFFYDIDLAISILRAPSEGQKGLIAYCPEAFTKESQEILEKLDEVDKITIPYDEAVHGFAANLVSTGETVVMSALAPKLKEKIENAGLKVLTPTIHELSKGGGYIRCTTLTIS